MPRWLSRIHTVRFLLPLALVTGSFLVASRTTLPASHAAGFQPKAEPALALPAPIQAPEDEYTVKDGTILRGDGTTEPTEDQSGPSSPAKVDTLDIQKAYDRANRLKGQTSGKVFKQTVDPHWFRNNTRFWYRNDTKDGTKDFVVVDAELGTRQPAFDHDKIATALSKASGGKYQAARLPFQTIEFVDDDKAIKFKVAGGTWRCDLASYECTIVEQKKGLALLREIFTIQPDANRVQAPAFPPADEVVEQQELPEDADQSPEELQAKQKQKKQGSQQKQTVPAPGASQAESPDGKWTAFIKSFNLWLRDKSGKETQMTQDGVDGNPYGALSWSKDSKAVLFYRSQPGDNKHVYLIESSPTDQLPAKFYQRPYPRPGDKFPTHEMWVLDVDGMKANKVDVEPIDDSPNGKAPQKRRWSKDNKTFTFEKTDRGHQRFRIIEVEASTGKTRTILDEKAQTMVDHYTTDAYFVRYLDDTDEILYLSEMDGWRHIYLIDAKAGAIKKQITRGEWVVRKVDRVDVKNRQIWFQASGRNLDQDPYLIHFYRVNFDGTGLVALTAGNGSHAITYSPDGKFIIDTYSRVDMAPIIELRRVSDGSLVCGLEKADTSALEATGWRYPEVFVAKGRDGKTDIWGIVCRPQSYDVNKKYPVIEYIYAGPHSAHVRKKFAAYDQMAALAELGFIVVQIDGMGTGNRSRAFHDVCWKNLADAGFPDRILWIKALAKKYAYLDITRVGIYGTSAGGQNSTGAVLFHPEFYKVAVSSCGCHDNRLDKSSWNEAWMGLMGPHYEAQSNVTNAGKLEGHLLLIVGELDTNVPPESTFRVVDALIKAKKDFDLIVMPGLDHTGGGTYGDRRRWDYFVRHLHGIEPPERNAATKQ